MSSNLENLAETDETPSEEENILSSEVFEDGPIKETLKLFEDSGFRENFVTTHTKYEAESIKSIDGNLDEEAKSYVNSLVQQDVLKVISQEKGNPDLVIEDARRFPEFGKYMGKLRNEGINGTSVNDLYLQRLEAMKLDEEYVSSRKEAEQNLEQAKERELNILRSIYSDLAERHNDTQLLEAFSFWGTSPDSKGYRGPDGNGFNAGLIHYFEYRANAEKNGRYKNETLNFGVDGFIEYTNRIKKEIDNASSENSRLFEDSEGRQRMYTLSEQGDLIISFKKVKDPDKKEEEPELKIITIIPGQNKKTLDKSTDNPEERYLNQLKDGKREVSL